MVRRFAIASIAVVGAFLTLLGALNAADVGTRRALLTIAPPSWVLGAPNNAASLDFDFANGRYWQAPPIYGHSTTSSGRASTEYQADLTGLLHSFPPGIGAVTNVGIGSWQAATNEALWSRDRTNAVWVSVNMSAAHTATGADGAANSASLLTASGANGTILQTFTISSQAQTYSFYVRRITGSGEIDVTENNGTTWTALTSANCVQPGTLVASGIVTTGYVRCTIEATVLNPVIGQRIVVNGDAINIDFDQLEANTFATPPIPTTSATVARAADNIQSYLANSSAFSIFMKFTLGAIQTNQTYFQIGASPQRVLAMTNSSNLRLSDGTSYNLNAIGALSVATSIFASSVTTTNKAIVLNSNSVATNTSTSFPSGYGNNIGVFIGGQNATNLLNGIIKRIAIMGKPMPNGFLAYVASGKANF